MKFFKILIIIFFLININCSEPYKQYPNLSEQAASLQFEIEVKIQEKRGILNKIELIEFGLTLSNGQQSIPEEAIKQNEITELRKKIDELNQELFQLYDEMKKQNE